MKNLSTLFFIGILFVTLTLTGCGNSTDGDRATATPEYVNSEQIGGEGDDYADLKALLGNITYQDLFNVLNGALNKLNALQAAGYTTSADYQTLYNIINNLYTTMTEEKAQYEQSNGESISAVGETVEALKTIVDMAYAAQVGTPINQLLAQILKENGSTVDVYGMLEYALSADNATLGGLTKGISIGTFASAEGATDGKDRFTTVINVLNGILEPNGRYALLHTDLIKVVDALKANEIKGLTVGDAKELVATLLDSVIKIIDEDKTDNDQVIASAIITVMQKMVTELTEDLLLKNNNEAVVKIMSPIGKLMLDLVAVNSQTHKMNIISLIDDLQTIWPILKGVVSIDTEAGNTMGNFLTYLNKENTDGTDNPFMLGLYTLLFKALDIQDDTYNPKGTMIDTDSLTGANGLLVHLLGASTAGKSLCGTGGLYDFTALFTLLVTLTDNPDLLWTALNEGSALIGKVIGDETISVSFLKAFITPIDINGDGVKEAALLKDVLGLIHLKGVDFNGLLGDLNQLLAGIDAHPGSKTFDSLINLLGFLVQNVTVK